MQYNKPKEAPVEKGMIPFGKSYSDLGMKLKRNYNLQRLQDQPPTIPRADRKFKKLGNPYKWRRCEFCNTPYEARLNSKRRTCGGYDCHDAYRREWLRIHRTRVWQINDKHYAKVKQNPELMEKRRAHGRTYARVHREKISVYQKEYYQKNREKCLASSRRYRRWKRTRKIQKKYYHANKEYFKTKKTRYYIQNKDRLAAKDKERYDNNRDKILAKSKEYYEKNKESRLAYQKKYAEENREKIKATKRAYYLKRKNDLSV